MRNPELGASASALRARLAALAPAARGLADRTQRHEPRRLRRDLVRATPLILALLGGLGRRRGGRLRVRRRTQPPARAVSVLRVGVDATSWANRRGFGRFTRNARQGLVELVTRSRRTCLRRPRRRSRTTCRRQPRQYASSSSSRPRRRLPRPDSSRSVRRPPAAHAAVRRDRPDVFLFPSIYT